MSNQKNFRLGRGHNCDLRLDDISVSRKHAEISCEGQKFFIQDKGSKFGTLLL